MIASQASPKSDSILDAFATIPLPGYVAPTARPVMGRHNDRIYALQQVLLQAELDTLAAQEGLAAALRALYDQQVDIGFIQDDLSQVSYFRYRANGGDERFFIVQFNPRRAERFKGAGRKMPPIGSQVAGAPDPSCFLCSDNIRWQHRGVQSYYQFAVNDQPYNALCNPFPFMRAHLTIAASNHVPQAFHVTGDAAQTQARIQRIVADLYDLVAQLPTFVGFYNGAGAGASIEKHLHYHFFETPDGHGAFPLQCAAAVTERKLGGAALDSESHRGGTEDAEKLDATQRSLRLCGETPSCLKIEGYPLSAYRVRGDRDLMIRVTVDLALTWDRQSGEAASANIIALWEQGAVSLYLIPRNRFYTRSPGLDGMVAGLETLGEFILCTEDEQRAIREQRVNYDYLWRILEAVRPPEGMTL